MNVFRIIISVILFCISSHLVYDLLANGFNWLIFVVCISGYLVIHFIWPKKETEESAWFDILEFVVELPYRAIALFLRSISKIFRDGDIGIDL